MDTSKNEMVQYGIGNSTLLHYYHINFFVNSHI